MFVESIQLKNFRNYKELDLRLSKDVNVFVGNNAQGKTNLLESVYLCSGGRSWRTHSEKELIRFNQDEAHVRLLINHRNTTDKVDVHIRKDGKKGIAINALPIRKLDQLFGNLLTVVFSPEDLQLVKAGPTERRRFMDMELCQLNAVYFYELQQYYHILKQRNQLLKNLKTKRYELDKNMLEVWDDQLVAHGIKIMRLRSEFVVGLNDISQKIHGGLTNAKEDLQISYKPNVSEQEFKEKLRKNIERDILQGATSVGIHKDDILFFIQDYDVRIYGSQGQQRTAALSVKLAEIEMIQQKTGNDPVLLLDDVLSELDENRQKYFLNNMSGVQTIITCTGLAIEKGSVYRVSNGEICLEAS